jgi:hypothetical protein
VTEEKKCNDSGTTKFLGKSEGELHNRSYVFPCYPRVIIVAPRLMENDIKTIICPKFFIRITWYCNLVRPFHKNNSKYSGLALKLSCVPYPSLSLHKNYIGPVVLMLFDVSL